MGDFDRTCRYLARHLDAVGLLRWLLGGDDGLVFSRWMDTRTVPAEDQSDRTGDLLVEMTEAGIGPYWAILVEFQTIPDATMFGRVLEMLGRIWKEQDPPGEPADRYQVAAVVVNLTGRGRASRDMVAAGGRLRTCLQVIERNLAEEDAGPTLEAIARGELASVVLAWIPLMRGGGEEGIIQRWQEIALGHRHGILQSELAASACILAEAAGREGVWSKALEGWGMEKSQFLQGYVAMGEAKGLAIGEAKGLAIGEAKGKAEGKAEGSAAAILLILRARFPQTDLGSLIARIESNTDLRQLQEWLKTAATVSSLEEFMRQLGS